MIGTIIEWLGTGTGILGATIMAHSVRLALSAYILWLVSSVSLTLLGFIKKLYGIALMNGVFTVINLVGLFNSLHSG